MNAVAAIRQRAMVIDDAYARPSPSDLQKCLQTLRRFLGRTPLAKAWFDANFGLTGNVQTRSYFDPLLGNPEKVLELWRRREECPDSAALLADGMPDLAGEVEPLQRPLAHIESALRQRGWDFNRFSALPDADAIQIDVELIVIDYVLAEDVPADIAAKVAESTQFLQRVIERIAATPDRRMPLILLVSSQPTIAKVQAERFRKSVGIQGAYFHFVRKSQIPDKLGNRLDGFAGEVQELEAYRRAHGALQEALAESVASLQETVMQLELQDIAALHVGHLLHEGEPLSDYLGWMLGQVLTTKLQKAVKLADASDRLPAQNYRLLLGHLSPTHGIPKLFCELSSVKAASGDLQKTRRKTRELRFGDIFAASERRNIDTSRFLLVISQTCDLVQCKITNGKVLCVEGSATEVEDSEAGLMRATFRQLDDTGNTLIFHDGRYFQISWREMDLCSVEQGLLKSEKKYKYMGRLNEIYALEVQHNSLNRLGRVGVPVKPGYGVVFGAFRLRFWAAKSEVTGLAASFENKNVVAVLRPSKKESAALLLSGELRKWLVARLKESKANDALPEPLKQTVDDLIQCLDGAEDFHFICKRTSKENLQLSWEKKTVNAGTGKTDKQPINIQKLGVVLEGAAIFDRVSAPEGVRVQLEFVAIN